MDEEKRHFTRVEFDARAIITHNGLTVDGKLIDISLKGALAKFPQVCTLSVGDPCEVTIDMGCEHDPIQYDATVKHINGNIVGLHCDRISPESAATLRKIIELNLGNDKLLHRELEAMVAYR